MNSLSWIMPGIQPVAFLIHRNGFFHTYNVIVPVTFLQIGGGGTYANIGARLWLPPSEIGMIVNRGVDFPPEMDAALKAYGEDMWLFREQSPAGTTRAINRYQGDHRGFQYLTPRLRITPRDLLGTCLSCPATIHFICSPTRAAVIMSQVAEVEGWSPISIYEPIPVSYTWPAIVYYCTIPPMGLSESL